MTERIAKDKQHGTTGLVLFGHGARDARWREPFERLLELVRTRHSGPVALAFLEQMSPDLQAACHGLVAGGASEIVVVPIFLGTGGHLRRDLPELIGAAHESTGVPVRLVAAVGESDGVLKAIAEYAILSVA